MGIDNHGRTQDHGSDFAARECQHALQDAAQKCLRRRRRQVGRGFGHVTVNVSIQPWFMHACRAKLAIVQICDQRLTDFYTMKRLYIQVSSPTLSVS